MEWLMFLLLGLIILMLCFIIFTAGRLFENILIIRELDEKIETLNSELAILEKWIGEE